MQPFQWVKQTARGVLQNVERFRTAWVPPFGKGGEGGFPFVIVEGSICTHTKDGRAENGRQKNGPGGGNPPGPLS